MAFAILHHYRRFAWAMFAFMAGLTVLGCGGDKTVLVYRVVDSTYTEGVTQDTGAMQNAEVADVNMDELIRVIRKRLDATKKSKITVRAHGPKQVEIIVPKTMDEEGLESLNRRITSHGTLEFRITASPTGGSFHEQIIKIAKGFPDRQVFVVNEESGSKEVLGWWIPVAEGREEDFKKGNFVVRPGKENEKEVLEALVVNDPYNVQGKYLRDVWTGLVEIQPMVHFTLNDEGAYLFGLLTGVNLKKQLGIILDGHVYTAPVIQSQILGDGQISGLTKRETEDLAAILNAGLMPAVLELVPDDETK